MSESGRSESVADARVHRAEFGAGTARDAKRGASPAVTVLTVAPTPPMPESQEKTTFFPGAFPLDLAPLDPARNGVLKALNRIERNTVKAGKTANATGSDTPSSTPAQPTRGVSGRFATPGSGTSLRQQVYRVKRIERQVERSLPPAPVDTAAPDAKKTADTPQPSDSPFQRHREKRAREEDATAVASKVVKQQSGAAPVVNQPGSDSDDQKAITATPGKPLTADELRKMPLRNDDGQFLSRDKKAGMSQAELAQAKAREDRQAAKKEDKSNSLLGQLGEVAKETLTGKGDATDGVGTAVGNAYYSAAKEAYGAYEELAGEGSKGRELYKWAQGHWDKRKEARQGSTDDAGSGSSSDDEAAQQAAEKAKQDAAATRQRHDQANEHNSDLTEELEALAKTNEDGFEEVVQEVKRIQSGGGTSIIPTRNPFRRGPPGGGARPRPGGRPTAGSPPANTGRMARMWQGAKGMLGMGAAAGTAAGAGTGAGGGALNAVKGWGGKVLGGGSRLLGAAAAPITAALAYSGTKNELAERSDLTEAQKSTTATATGVGAGGGALAGAAAGALAGSIIPGVGTLVGTIVGGAIGAWGGEKAGRAVGDAVAGTMENVEEEARNALDEREKQSKAEKAKERKWYNPTTWFSGGGDGGGPENTQTSRRNHRGNRGGSTASPTPGGSASGGEREQALIRSMHDAGITDPNEQAAFMGQMHHESAGFSSMEESFNYSSADRIMSVSKTARDKGAAAVEQARSQGPEAVAALMYGGRMGNTEPGDGHRYRGRGFTQLTGRDNYTAASESLGIDLVNNPDMAADPEVAAKVATWYWKNRGGLSEAAQRGDTSEVTRLINGGQNGLADREVQTNRYLAAAQAGELTIEPQQDPGTQGGANSIEPGASAAPLVASSSDTPIPASPPAVEADARPITAASLGYDIASNASPVEPVLPSEPVTAIDDRQAAKAFHPAPARPQPGASRRAQRERAPAPTASASQDADGSGKPSAPRGGVSAPGVNDIQIGFSDPVLTLMAMDRI